MRGATVTSCRREGQHAQLEVVLVHRDRARSVTLRSADKAGQTTFDRAKALLALPEMPSGVLYRSGQSRQPPHREPTTVTAQVLAPTQV